VFDEYHFGRFVNQYCAGTYLFDIHPPLGKLTLFFAGKLFGYDHTVCSYNSISDAYNPTCKFWVLRATAAVFGSATAPLMFGIARGFGGGIWAGILCASLFIFDNLNLTEARLVLIDSQLIFWCAATLWTAQRWWARLAGDMGAREKGAPAGDPRLVDARERNLWCLAMGITASSAISIKWTGLATPGMVAMESFFAFFFLRRPVYLQDLLKILVVSATLYFLWFFIHFKLLPLSGGC
jgi:dolichyl-phosphate-mannose-protein mannosyltransferase